MADIFISYSQKDRDRVAPLVEALTAEGYDVWWDLRIRAGESFDELIEGTLERVACVVGVWSKHSVKAEWVRAECAWAKDQRVFVSVRIDDDARLPLKFYNVHTPSLAHWGGAEDDSAYRSLLRDIQALAGVPAADRHRGSGPPDEREPFSRFRDPLRDGGEGPEMLVLPAGRFWMGSPQDELARSEDEGPRHPVVIQRAFAMGVTPVTFACYDQFSDATGHSWSSDEGWGRGTRPTLHVSWSDAQAYASWLSEQTGRCYRLPTEAEWEYACRAGTETAWSFGGQETDIDQYAWHSANAQNRTHRVGQKQPNPWGLHDTHGNILEWVEDCFRPTYERCPHDGSACEPAPGEDGCLRVLRGGSWYHHAAYLRSAVRYRNPEDYRSFHVGFRLARDV